MEGWIKLYRQLITNGWLKNHNLLVVWIYCLLKTSHKPMTIPVGYQEVHLQPGQFIFGRRKAAEETGLSEKQIRLCMTQLKFRRNVAIKMASKYSIVSIINWEAYQGVDTGEGPAEGPSKGPAKGQQRATNKNNKKEKIYSPESDELVLASLLFGEILKNKPDFKEPNLQSWAKEIDFMIRKDNRNPTRIRQVIQWAQKNDFWHKNILSTAKLREKFDQLELQMGKEKPW